MPQFTVNTNVARSNIPGGFISELSSLVAKLAGKPEGVSSLGHGKRAATPVAGSHACLMHNWALVKCGCLNLGLGSGLTKLTPRY